MFNVAAAILVRKAWIVCQQKSVSTLLGRDERLRPYVSSFGAPESRKVRMAETCELVEGVVYALCSRYLVLAMRGSMLAGISMLGQPHHFTLFFGGMI